MSKFNALKHGLLAKQAIVNSQDSRVFNKLAKRLLTELHPESLLEMILAEQVVINYWRLKRYLKLENELFLYAGEQKLSFGSPRFISAFTDFIKRNPSFDVLARYNASILRSFYKSLHEYQNVKNAKSTNKVDNFQN